MKHRNAHTVEKVDKQDDENGLQGTNRLVVALYSLYRGSSLNLSAALLSKGATPLTKSSSRMRRVRS